MIQQELQPGERARSRGLHISELFKLQGTNTADKNRAGPLILPVFGGNIRYRLSQPLTLHKIPFLYEASGKTSKNKSFADNDTIITLLEETSLSNEKF
jgi:hypothetical protein